jgi:hypothetical protein
MRNFAKKTHGNPKKDPAARAKAIAEMDRKVAGVKAHARQCIETNAPNADKMREAMVHVIAYEKAGGTYDPATWTWLDNRSHPAPDPSDAVYYDEVLDFFEDFDHAKFMTWLGQQPPLEQVEIMRQFRDVLEQVNATVGNNPDMRVVIDDLSAWADSYHQACLREEMAKLNLEIALAKRDEAFAEMDKTVEGVKAYARECIETNAPNAEAMRALTVHIIAYEKGNGTYDPATWAWLENP